MTAFADTLERVCVETVLSGGSVLISGGTASADFTVGAVSSTTTSKGRPDSAAERSAKSTWSRSRALTPAASSAIACRALAGPCTRMTSMV